jgi:uncharacterized protein
MKSKLVMCLFFVWMSAGAWAQTTVSIAPDAASKEDVRKLFDLMSSKEQVRQMMEQMFQQMRTMNREQMKKRHPDVSEEEMARLDRQSEDLIKNFPLDDMLNDMIPVYQKHFTKADIDGLTAFYSSPTGQKFLHEIPAVTGETMRVVLPRIQASVEQAMKQADQERNSSPK